jgi:hypothetical protein
VPERHQLVETDVSDSDLSRRPAGQADRPDETGPEAHAGAVPGRSVRVATSQCPPVASETSRDRARGRRARTVAGLGIMGWPWPA